ncbi:MAG: hypothetical protein AAGF97_16460 [Planctomycetota bacterium]
MQDVVSRLTYLDPFDQAHCCELQLARVEASLAAEEIRLDEALRLTPRIETNKPIVFREELEDIALYRSLGAEDETHPCRMEGCDRGTVRLSAHCATHHFEMVRKRAPISVPPD